MVVEKFVEELMKSVRRRFAELAMCIKMALPMCCFREICEVHYFGKHCYRN